MKFNTKIFSILMSIAFVLVSCQEDDLGGKYNPAQVGDEIAFGGTSGYEDEDEGRTAYGDKQTGANGFTEIKWYYGDMVRIYCADARTTTNKDGVAQSCDYIVRGTTVVNDPSGTVTNPVNGTIETSHSARLERATDEEVGLQWGSEGTHTFYGVYPSPDQLVNAGDTENAGKLQLKGNILTGYLPEYQNPFTFVSPTEVTEGSTKYNLYTVHPSMRYAYMVASETVSAPTQNGVALKFNPIVTAVEFVLVNTSVDETYDQYGNLTATSNKAIEDIRAITISSSSAAIAGAFTTTIGENSTFTNSNTGNLKAVTIPIASATSNAVTLQHGDKLKFTAFLLPNTDLDELIITLELGIGEKTTKLNNQVHQNFKINATKKNFVTNLGVNLGNEDEVQQDKWMYYLTAEEKAKPISALSIPGAGGAWSGCKNASGGYHVEDAYREQNLSFDELWAQGVRCFEMQVDDEFNLHCNMKNLYVDGSSTRLTFDTAISQVIKKVNNNNTECAFVIVTYSNTDGIDKRDSGSFQSTLSSKVNDLSNIIAWDPAMTYSQAAGKVIIISRPGSIGVDYGWHGLGTANNKVLSVLGWGSMPDQWYARGFGKLQNYYSDCYTVKNNVVYKTYTLIANSLDIYNKSTVNSLTALRPFTANGWNGETKPTYSNGKWTAGSTSITSNFGYYAVTNKDRYGNLRTSVTNNTWDGHNAWVQEWKRVVKDNNLSVTSGSYTYNWVANIDEKWDDITEALTKSMNDANRTSYKYYINSLCGYFATSTSPSYMPTLNVQRYGVEKVSSGLGDVLQQENVIKQHIYVDGKYQNSTSTSVAEGFISGSMNISVSEWGPYSANAGLSGDVASYAKWVNDKFYDYLLSLQAGNKLPGPTGIVLMDRISNDKVDNPAGYYCPQIIISNNDLKYIEEN